MARQKNEQQSESFDSTVTDIVQKKHRNRPDLQNFGADLVEPGDNTRYLRNALVAFELPAIDISDPKQVDQRIKDYFAWCMQNDQKPKVMGIANWLGVSRDTINSWKREECRAGTHSDIIKRAYGILEELWEGYMQDNRVNTVAGIFLGKIFFDYKEPTEIILTPGNPLGAENNADEVAQKYAKLPSD